MPTKLPSDDNMIYMSETTAEWSRLQVHFMLKLVRMIRDIHVNEFSKCFRYPEVSDFLHLLEFMDIKDSLINEREKRYACWPSKGSSSSLH